jgi:cyclopropane fatty-acyl-phospholipid synthase-like methyltransferase
MSIANADQAGRCNSGEDLAHWIDNQARHDRMNEPFSTLILDAAALRPGGHVLDMGCGCGGTTLAAARLIAPGQAVGIGLSGPMPAGLAQMKVARPARHCVKSHTDRARLTGPRSERVYLLFN